MRLVPLLILALSVTACDKAKGGGGLTEHSKDTAEATGSAGAKPDPVAKETATKEAEKAKAPEPPPKAPEPPTKTGVLDLEIQKVAGGYKIVTPRITQLFATKPTVQRQDAQTPFGDTIPGAVAVVEGGDRFAGLIYIPIPKQIPYDVPKGLKGARDGMLGMFDGKYDAKDDKVKLGPFDANHVVAEGERAGHKFHVEAWIAYDDVGRTVYGLMSLRMPGDLDGIGKLPEGFTLRPDAPMAKPADTHAKLPPLPIGKNASTKAPAKPATAAKDNPF